MDHKTRTVSFSFLLLLALMVLLLPLRWIMATLLAATIHELGHYIAVQLCGGHITSLKFGSLHSVMEVSELSHWLELLCIGAGPLAGLFSVLLSPWLPMTAVCSLIQTVYNLLPIYPLDGGRMIRCIGEILKLQSRLLAIIEIILLIMLTILVIIVGIRLGFGIFLGGCLLLGRAISGKIPCKPPSDWI